MHLADRPFLELSRGEQRRVLIARGLGFNPEILLLDEPVAGLDAEFFGVGFCYLNPGSPHHGREDVG